MIRTTACIRVVALWGVVSLACVPVPGDAGGSIPPPVVGGGGIAPPFDPNPTTNGGGGTLGGDSSTFAVSVDAHSLSVDGIAIDAVLTVVRGVDGFGARTVTEAVLQDTQNQGDIGDTAIVGGLFLTASRGSLDGFDLTTDPDGSAVATFRGNGGLSRPNRFVLPVGGQVFVAGTIGDTHEVGSGSRFTFFIDGDRVTGTLALNGFPIATFGDSEVYEGTFAGTRTR